MAYRKTARKSYKRKFSRTRRYRKRRSYAPSLNSSLRPVKLSRFLAPDPGTNGNTFQRLANAHLVNSYKSPAAVPIAFNDVQNAAELAVLWTSFKFVKLYFTWRLTNNIVQIGATPTADAPIPRLHVCYSTASEVPSTIAQMREFTSYRVFNLFPGKVIKYNIRPHHAMNTYDANISTIGYVPSTMFVYTQSDSIQVPWYGLIYAITDWPPRVATQTDNSEYSIDFDCRATMLLRNVH